MKLRNAQLAIVEQEKIVGYLLNPAHRVDDQVSYRRVLEVQFRLLARFLTGEIPQYPPFLTR